MSRYNPIEIQSSLIELRHCAPQETYPNPRAGTRLQILGGIRVTNGPSWDGKAKYDFLSSDWSLITAEKRKSKGNRIRDRVNLFSLNG
jgi:hypothetical protein